MNNIIDKLSVFKLNDNVQDLMQSDDYVWKNTINRTATRDLDDQLIRFSPKVDILSDVLTQLINSNKLNTNFTILELFCGNGAVLYMVKKKFPNCFSVGLDLLKFDLWEDITTEYPDINFIQSNFFDIYESNVELNLDVLITYNTWRGWDNGLGPQYRVSKDQFMIWAKKNFKYIIADNDIIL